jgi:site-specific recombinase XerD
MSSGQPTRPSLSQDIALFLTDRKARNLTSKTITFYQDELGLFLRWAEAQGVTDTLDLTPDHLRRYLLDLGRRRNPGGVHASYRALKTFLRWVEAEYEPPGWRNPIDKVRPPKLPQEPLQPIPLEHLQAMLRVCERRTFTGDRDRAILLALLDTGCRAGEFLALNLGDVDLDTGAILVRWGKGRKARTVFLGAKTRREVARYLRHRAGAGPDAPLWVTVDGRRLTYWGLRGMLHRRARAAGVPAPSPHAFRRTFALLSLRAGMDVHSLRRLMGHADIDILKRYLAQTEGDLRAAHDKAGPVDNLL